LTLYVIYSFQRTPPWRRPKQVAETCSMLRS